VKEGKKRKTQDRQQNLSTTQATTTSSDAGNSQEAIRKEGKTLFWGVAKGTLRRTAEELGLRARRIRHDIPSPRQLSQTRKSGKKKRKEDEWMKWSLSFAPEEGEAGRRRVHGPNHEKTGCVGKDGIVRICKRKECIRGG